MRESIRWTISSMRGCRLRPLSFLRANPSRGGVFTSYVRPHVCLSLETGRDGKAETARKAEIRGLQGKIPGLVETAVGVNISPRGQGYEFGGVMKFADKASLDSYGPHPVHQELVSWLMPLIEPIEVDFELRP